MAGTGIGAEAGAPTRTSGRERRVWERYLLAETAGTIIYRHLTLPCRLLDISLGGCRVRMEQRFAAGALARVDVVLELHGITQRIGAMTQWTGKDNQLGIQFLHASALAKNQFAALLTGLIDEVAAEAVKEVVKQAAALSAGAIAATASTRQPEKQSGGPAQAIPPSGSGEAAAIEPEQKQSQAVIRFLKDGFEMASEVVDLSLEGCTLRTVRPFTLGIYVRAEVSFHVRGLVFQLAGVSQEIYDKCTVGFRFLDVSRRKREELEQVIEELRAAKAKRQGQE
jgi:hypothetical protein